MCTFCNNGWVIAVEKIIVKGKVIESEYSTKCTCKGGNGLNWKYPKDIELTEQEEEIYSKLKKGGIVCPF